MMLNTVEFSYMERQYINLLLFRFDSALSDYEREDVRGKVFNAFQFDRTKIVLVLDILDGEHGMEA